MGLEPDHAKELLLSGRVPDELEVDGALDLGEGARIGRLPSSLRCHILRAPKSDLESIPTGIEAPFRIDLDGCGNLTELPDGLSTGTLILRDCARLERLPSGLRVNYLDLTGCEALSELPDDLEIRFGRLDLSGCVAISRLPVIGPLSHLVLIGLSELRTLPDGLEVSSWLDVAFSGLSCLPDRLNHVPLRWRGVPVSRRIAFEGESLAPEDILNEENAELRRVMIESLGYERFLDAVEPKVLDQDRDPGGPRQLLEVDIESGENLVCVSMACPSTGRRYIVRVPPQMETCHQAVAWIAGFDDPDDYRPVVET